jgi:hypothetical protein
VGAGQWKKVTPVSATSERLVFGDRDRAAVADLIVLRRWKRCLKTQGPALAMEQARDVSAGLPAFRAGG